MKCPNCQKDIMADSTVCPYCDAQLSFTVKDSEDSEKIDEVIETVGKIRKKLPIVFIIFFLIIPLLGFLAVIGMFYAMVQGWFHIIFISMKACFIIGVIFLVIGIILLLKKYKRKLGYILLLTAVIMIGVVIYFNNKLNQFGIATDYSKAEYIEIGDEKIPSVYSIFGYKKIYMATSSENEYDSQYNMTLENTIFIVYKDKFDIEKYQEALISNGFITQTIQTEDGFQNILVKNNLTTNKFYTVAIDGETVSYTVINGRYEEVLRLYG